MQRQFLPTGRVQYFPMSEYRGDGRIVSLVSGAETHVTTVRKRVVDATYLNVTVPSTQPPRYAVDPGVACVPPNELPKVAAPYERYVVIGAGKTGIDACLWLLRNDVAPEHIIWIMPRDAWMNDRANIQFGGEFYERSLRGRTLFFEAAARSETLEDLFLGLEDCGQLLRLDKDVWPTMYRCATVTNAELEQLRRVENIVRLGRVSHLKEDAIVLADGTIPTDANSLHIDCTADGLPPRPAKPIFEGEAIILQTVRPCQQTFSAALIGHVEVAFDDDETKNQLCQVVPNPDSHIDWLSFTLGTMQGQRTWTANDNVREWLKSCRLDIFSRAAADRPTDSEVIDDLTRRAAGSGKAAMARLVALLAAHSPVVNLVAPNRPD